MRRMEETYFSILVVDDDVSDLNALHHILKDSYTVYFAKSGKSALKRTRENSPDLILLDVVMPDMNGFEVLAALKEDAETRDIPVIFITGKDAVEDEEEGFRLGAVDYIRKPFYSVIVKARVRAHLNIVRQLSEKDDARILIKTRQEVRNILFRTLVYVDVSGHWLRFHLANEEQVEVYASLKEYEDVLLADPRFAHCHKSFIVNMDYVDVVEVRDVRLKNNERLPISKNYLGFKKRYLDWING